MSGHNKWSSIKHKKGAADAKRGKIFTRIMREITVAAKEGGGDPETNSRLRLAVANAKSNNMPKDNVERAIKKGTGEIAGAELHECLFEGYGPNGVAILVEGTTDNTNRTSSEVRSIFTKNNGNLGAQGSVAWIFDKKGMIVVDKNIANEETLMEMAINAGADDIVDAGDNWEIWSDPEHFETVRNELEKQKIAMASAELSRIPKNTVALELDDARKVLKLLDKLEEIDDVQNVHGNFDISEEVMQQLANE